MRRLIAVVTTVAFLAVSAGAAQGSVPGAAGAPAVQGSAELLQHLSVLQRAQVPADVIAASQLPPVQRPRLVSSLSRLVDTVAGTNIYLVVLRPLVGPVYLWKPDLGDVAELIAVTAHSRWRTDLSTSPVPAAHLSDGNATGRAQSGRTLLGVQLVPDGVAEVTWTIAAAPGGGTQTVQVTPVNNVAVAPIPSVLPQNISATWRAADGTTIPTSKAALTTAEASERLLEHRALVTQVEKASVPASPKLLAAFKIFSVTSRTGVKVGAVTVSHPRVSALPMGVLETALNEPDRLAHAGLDVTQVREATTANGTHIYVIPGRHGMAVSVNGGAGVSDDLAQSIATGDGFTSGYPGRGTWHYGIRPDSLPTLQISLKSGGHRTLHLSDGIYADHTGP